MNIDMATYETKHYGDEDCPFEKADQRLLYRHLQEDHVPLTLYHERSGTHQLEIIPPFPDEKYVAVSHVWAHGLGNPHGNSLPQCQLRRLQGLINDLYSADETSVPFWIDTLSCPTEPEEATELAILKMRKTYADAEMVLVIDSYLTDIESNEITDLECLLRIICSGWMLRLWALQEALLAKRLYFQFADVALDIDEVFQSLASDAFESEYSDIAMKLIELRDVFYQRKDMPMVDIVYLLSRAVRYRATSVSTDEALCLGTLANMDMEEIAEASGEDRMRKFWSLIPKHSSLPLFWSGERLTARGFRWAPRSFLHQSTMFFDAGAPDFEESFKQEETYLSEEGLVTKGVGIILDHWTLPIESGFWLKDQSENWYYITAMSTDSSSSLRLDLDCREMRTDAQGFQLVLIPKATLHPRPYFSGMELRQGLGLLALMPKDLKSIVHVRIITQILITPIKEMTADDEQLRLLSVLKSKLEEARNSSLNESRTSMDSSDLTTSLKDQGLLLGTINDVEDSDLTCDARDEILVSRTDGRWSAEIDGHHAMFEGFMISQEQTWCFD